MESTDESLSLEIEPPPPGRRGAAIRLTQTGMRHGHARLHRPRAGPRFPRSPTSAPTSTASAAPSTTSSPATPPSQGGNALHKVKGHLSRTPQPLDSLRRDVPLRTDPHSRPHDGQGPRPPLSNARRRRAARLTPFVAPPKPPRRKLRIALAACARILTIALAGRFHDRTPITAESSSKRTTNPSPS